MNKSEALSIRQIVNDALAETGDEKAKSCKFELFEKNSGFYIVRANCELDNASRESLHLILAKKKLSMREKNNFLEIYRPHPWNYDFWKQLSLQLIPVTFYLLSLLPELSEQWEALI